MGSPKLIVLIGPPASGKSMQAELVAEKYGMRHISTGDLLRRRCEAVRNRQAGAGSSSEVDSELAGFINAGKLVPDEIIIRIVKEEVKGERGGVILDGVPRTLEQAKGIGMPDLAIIVNVDDSVVLKRSAGRRGGRSDDNAEVMKVRIGAYHAAIGEIRGFYAEKGRAWDVDGNGSVESTFEKIESVLRRWEEETRKMR